MNKELQSLLTNLEKFIYQSENYTFTLDAHQVHLILDHIANQGEEIERLNNEIKEKKEIINKFIADENGGVSFKLQNENERLNNIINKLEKYAMIMRKHNIFETGTQAYHNMVIKIEELKEYEK